MSRLRRALLADVAEVVLENVEERLGRGRGPTGELSPVTELGEGSLRRLRVTLTRGDRVLSALSLSEDPRTDDVVAVVARHGRTPGLPGSGLSHVDAYAGTTALADFARVVGDRFRSAATSTLPSLPTSEHLARVLDGVGSLRLDASLDRVVRPDTEPTEAELAAVEAVLAGAPLEWALRRLAGAGTGSL